MAPRFNALVELAQVVGTGDLERDDLARMANAVLGGATWEEARDSVQRVGVTACWHAGPGGSRCRRSLGHGGEHKYA